MPSAPSSRISMVKWLDADAIGDGVDGQPYAGTWGGLSQATTAKRPVYRRAGMQGRACLSFAGTQFIGVANDPAWYAAISVPQSAGSGGYTFSAICRPSSTGPVGSNDPTYQTVFSASSNNGPYWLVQFQGGSQGTSGFQFRPFTGGSSSTSYIPDNAHLVQVTVAFTAANTATVDTYVNGQHEGQQTGVNFGGAADGMYIGANASGQFGLAGDVSQFWVDNVVLGAPALASDVAYFQGRYSSTSSLAVACVGDSRTVGVDATQPGGVTPYPYPLQLQPLLASALYGYNVAVAKSTAYAISASTVGGWAPNNSSTRGQLGPCSLQQLMIVRMLGYNDLNSSESQSAVVGYQVATEGYYQNTSSGITVVCTEPDSSLGDPIISNYNAALIDALPPIAGKRALARLDLNPLIGPAGSSSNPLYYDGSSVHLTGETPQGAPGGGYGVIASVVASAAASLLRSITASGALTAGVPGTVTLAASALGLTGRIADYALSNGTLIGVVPSGNGSSAVLSVTPSTAGTLTVTFGGVTSNAVTVVRTPPLIAGTTGTQINTSSGLVARHGTQVTGSLGLFRKSSY